MSQDEVVYIPKSASKKEMADKILGGITRAQAKADHAKNVSISRNAASDEITYYGSSGDVAGSKKVGERMGSAADSYTKKAARLPVRDAEDAAHRTAVASGGFTTKTRPGRKDR